MRSRHRYRAGVVVAAAFLAIACSAGTGCKPRPTYECSANDGCVSEDGSPGICEASASCSFQDAVCTDSGRRYPDGAGAGLASACVSAPADAKCIAHVALGTSFGCLVKVDGSVWCWGDNVNGQLGDGTNTPHPAPTRVKLPDGVKAKTVVAGQEHACVLTDQGTVWCWGLNETKQLGVGTTNSNVPVQPVFWAGTPPKVVTATALAAGGKHTCAVADKIVYCWGENSDGQCGSDPKIADDVDTPTAVAGLEGVIEPSIGDEFSCARKDDKSAWCWGANANGELGNGSTTPSFVPMKSTISSVSQISAGDEHVCVVKEDGAVFCWGYGQSGAIGNLSKDDQKVPVAVTTAQVVASAGQSFHTCATQINGNLLCWGANDAGQVGAGRDEANLLAPTEASLITVREVALGGKHTCALTTDGALWCWGANAQGQLGLGAPGAPQKSPRRVAFDCGK